VPLAEPLDLGAQVLLGVKPGPGDPGRAADGVEGDALAGGIHAPQGGDGALAGLLGAAVGAAMTWRELSARIGGLGFVVGFDFADHLVQVGEDLLVHLRDPGLAVAGSRLDQGERAVPLLAQLGHELRPG